MTETQHFSPGDIQFQLVYDRGQCADSSYLIQHLGWRTFLFQWYITANFSLSILGSYIPIVAEEALICLTKSREGLWTH